MSKEEYRENVETIIDFLSGRYRHIEKALDQGMKKAAGEQEFEQAAQYRNKLKAVRSLLERQRISNAPMGSLDAIAVDVEGVDANAQVFQIRDGMLPDRQSFYLENAREREEGEVAEEFMLQYYASAIAVPPQVVVQPSVSDPEALSEALTERRGAPVEVRHAERGDKRRILELARAEREARPGPGSAPLRAAPLAADRGARRAPAGARNGADPDAGRVLRHLQPDGPPHGRVDGGLRGRGAQEVGLPALRHPGLRSG